MPPGGKEQPRSKISQLECDSSNVYVTAWSDQLKKRISVCVDTVASRSVLRRNLVEPWSNLVINQHEWLILQTAIGELSAALGSVHLKLKLSTSVIEGKFFVIDIYDECILGLDLMRKYGLVVDPRSRLLGAPHGDIPLLALETTAIQQGCSKVDPVQERVKSCQKTLSAEQIKSLKKTLHDYCDVFAQIIRTSFVQHQINTGNRSPIKQALRRVPLAKSEEIESLTESMKGSGIIEPSSSPWSSLLTLVSKNDGTIRFCVDYWKLNKVTRKDSNPLPCIDDIFDVFHGAKWFCTLDLKSRYWQVEVSPLDQEKVAITTGFGLWQFAVMLFGSATHQQPLNDWWKQFFMDWLTRYALSIWMMWLSLGWQ